MPEIFAERHGIERAVPEIAIIDDFPVLHREAALQIAHQLGVTASSLRKAMLEVLVTGIDTTHFSPDYIWDDLVLTLPGCDWPDVYEIAQEIYKVVPANQQQEYEKRLNRFFERNGFGWMMRDGLIEYRGSKSYQEATKSVDQVLQSRGLNRSAESVQEAMRALSRRPDPDLPGAVNHAMRALEAVARIDTGNPVKTLGALVSSLDLPKPLDEAVSKLWGFSSQYTRHGSEEKAIDRDEAELVVTVTCAIAAFVANRQPLTPLDAPLQDSDDLPFV